MNTTTSLQNLHSLYTFDDLLHIFPFRKTKLRQLLNANALPVVKIGRHYITSDEAIQRWILENAGKEIFY